MILKIEKNNNNKNPDKIRNYLGRSSLESSTALIINQ